jgi:hypothetical protein
MRPANAGRKHRLDAGTRPEAFMQFEDDQVDQVIRDAKIEPQ